MDLPHGHTIVQPPGNAGLAARIRGLRIRAGKSPAEMTQLLGLNPAWYADLEQRDDELVSTLTLFQTLHLASIFGIPMRDLMGEAADPDQRIALMELPDRIVAHTKRNGMTIGQFEDGVGWELRDFLKSPVRIAAELPIAFLQAIAAALGINWLSLVPDEEET
jgi:transcriptional regulator with XRE-family HTH domain